MLHAGSRIGPYEIVSLLGSGGWAKFTARATTPGPHRRPQGSDRRKWRRPRRRQRFEQEARAASALNHPNILSVYDMGSQDGLVYIVSELIDGETLRDHRTRPAAAEPRC